MNIEDILFEPITLDQSPQFHVGDVVRTYNYAVPLDMTVVDIQVDGVICTWFDADGYNYQRAFPSADLILLW